MNIPYVVHTVDGIPINPVTKDKPVVNIYPNRAMRRFKPGRSFSNKKGVQLVVVRTGAMSFLKVKKRVQLIQAVDYTLKGIPTGVGGTIPADIHVKQHRRAIAQNIVKTSLKPKTDGNINVEA